MKKNNTKPAAVSAPAAAPMPEVRGYVVREAVSDVSSWFSVKLSTCSPFIDDPLVTIELDRRNAHLVGEPRQTHADFIETFRASDLDSLVEALQAAIGAARAFGVVPPSTGLPAWRQAHAKFAAVEARGSR